VGISFELAYVIVEHKLSMDLYNSKYRNANF